MGIVTRAIVGIAVTLVVVLLVLVLERSLRIEPRIEGAQRLSVAQFYFKNRQQASRVQLPHNWDITHPNRGGIGHYILKFKLAEVPKTALGIYLPKLSMNAQVFVNGQDIGSGGSMQEPVARYWNLPLYFVASPGLLHRGDNRLRVDIAGFPNGRSGIDPIFIGPDTMLRLHYQNHRLDLLMLDIGSFGINLILGLMLLVWAYRTADMALGYFGIGAIVSCIAIADSFWIEIPLHRFVWRWVTHSSMALSIIFFYLFMLRMLRRAVGPFERFMISYLLVGIVVLLFAEEGQLLPWAKWVHFGSLVIMFQLVFLCLKHWLVATDSVRLWLGACMTIVISFGMVDWLPVLMNEVKRSPYVYYIGPVAFSFAVALGLLARYINAMTAQQSYTSELQSSLADQELTLERQHLHIVALERDRAVNDERTRIMRELHDGIGGQLMGALALSEEESGYVGKRIRYALDELRIIMDSLDPEANFETILAMLRQRIEPELHKHHVRLRWKIKQTPEVFAKSPERCLHGLRIIQEAMINALKHAEATEIEICVEQQSLSVRDNGRGIGDISQVSGRGVANMRWRAAQLNARFSISSTKTQGTSVSLKWASS